MALSSVEAEVEVEVRGEWSTLSADVETITGVHALWLKFYGAQGNLFSVDWIRFE